MTFSSSFPGMIKKKVGKSRYFYTAFSSVWFLESKPRVFYINLCLNSMSLKLLYIKGEKLSKLEEHDKVLPRTTITFKRRKQIFILLYCDLDRVDMFLFFTLCFKRQNRSIGYIYFFDDHLFWITETSFLITILSYKLGGKKWEEKR